MLRSTRPISEIYNRCNVAIVEPTNFEEASKFEEWNHAMKEEMATIQDNKTW